MQDFERAMWNENGNAELFDEGTQAVLKALVDAGQGHLFEKWPGKGQDDEEKMRMANQLVHLNKSYPGGLVGYVESARKLLAESKAGTNPLAGYVPEVPDGLKLDPADPGYPSLETRGAVEAQRSAFVLVAGGLGERLGYSGIKVALPVDSISGKCFLQFYIETLLALQGDAPPIPLAIMTSDDTHARTEQLLKENESFGAVEGQVTLIKQEKVACLTDSEAHLSLAGPYEVETKPHGHGDVHGLLHSSGLARKWAAEGRKWVCFFQDTNPAAFNGLLPTLAVSADKGFDMTSVAVPRKAKEAIGAIARLEPDGSVPGQRAVTINVEYNQLDPMLRASRDYPDGDVNDASGSSPFPGNINELVVALPMYVDVLEATGGVIGEFVNPKYKDETRKAFKKSTRLECMMQDLPKSFPESAKVGFVSLPTWLAFSPVKNSPEEAVAKVAAGTPSHSATSSELEVYERNCRLLEIAGAATVGEPKEGTFNGIACRVYPMVSVAPSFALTIEQLRTRVSGLSLAPGSALVLEGDASLRDCKVDGALVVRALAGARVSVEGVEVRNGGWSLVPVDSKDPSHPEEALIRGFHVEKKGVREEAHTASAEVRG